MEELYINDLKEISGETIVESGSDTETFEEMSSNVVVEPDIMSLPEENKGNLHVLVIVITLCVILGIILGFIWGKKSANK